MTSRIESILAAVVVVAILGLAGWFHVSQVKKAEQAVHAHYAAVLADISDKTAAAQTAFRATETEWQKRIEGVTRDGQERIDTARLDADGARAESGRLRKALDRYRTAARTAPHSGIATAGQGDQGGDALDLLTGMLARHSDELVEVGRYADELHARGLSCERAYDTLTGTTEKP